VKRVHEFEAWSTPGKVLASNYGKTLQLEFWRLGIPQEVFLGLDSIPDQTDCDILRIAIERGELTKSDFEKFCAEYSLLGDLSDAESACRFLEFTEGRCLAWIHIPEGEEANILPQVTALLRERGHIVVDLDG
jgi:hypothetical protein